MKTKQNATVLDADSQPTARSGGDWIAKILCLLIAFIIWFYVMQVDSPEHRETFYSVNVTLTNTSVLEDAGGLSVYSGYGATVDVTVIGKKSTINKMKADDFSVVADVSKITEAGMHSVPIDVILPSGLSLDSTSQNAIQVYVDEKSSQVVEIRAKITSIMIGSQLEVGEPRPRHETVVVTGPKSALEEIDYAVINLSLGSVSASMTASGQLSLIGKNGEPIDNPYLRLARTDVTVDIPVYTTKTLPVVAKYKYGYFNDTNVRVTTEPSEITLRGDPAILDAMTELVITTLDEKRITGDVTQKIRLSLDGGVTAVDGDEYVTVSVSHIGIHTATFYVTDIDVKGNSGADYEILNDAIRVNVRGTLADLALLKPTDFTAIVDLSGYPAEFSGVVEKTPTIVIDSGYDVNVYEVDDPDTTEDDFVVKVRLN